MDESATVDIGYALTKVMTEYGGLVTLLIVAIVILLRFGRDQITRNNELADRLIAVIESNTKAMSELITHIKDL